MSGGAAPPDLRWLAACLGEPCEGLRERLGQPASDRTLGDGRWLVWEWAGATLRARGGAGVEGRLSAWSVAFREGFATLREAAESLGLWPACAPDESALGADAPLLRRAVPGPAGSPALTLTATLRDGRIAAVTLFDEAPEWR